jgi:hypothetical protein
MRDVKHPEVNVQIIGTDSNALALMGRVTRALRAAKVPTAEIDQFREEAMSGDYDNVLRTIMRWVEVE